MTEKVFQPEVVGHGEGVRRDLLHRVRAGGVHRLAVPTAVHERVTERAPVQVPPQMAETRPVAEPVECEDPLRTVAQYLIRNYVSCSMACHNAGSPPPGRARNPVGLWIRSDGVAAWAGNRRRRKPDESCWSSHPRPGTSRRSRKGPTPTRYSGPRLRRHQRSRDRPEAADEERMLLAAATAHPEDLLRMR